MSEQNKKLVRRWFEEVWNQGRREVIDELMPTECIIYDGSKPVKGPEEFKPFYDRIQSAFSESHMEVMDTIAEGDTVCARWQVTMRHTGDSLGLPATGKQVKISGISVIRFADGRMVEAWQNWDMMGMLEQLQGTQPAMLYMSAGT